MAALDGFEGRCLERWATLPKRSAAGCHGHAAAPAAATAPTPPLEYINSGLGAACTAQGMHLAVCLLRRLTCAWPGQPPSAGNSHSPTPTPHKALTTYCQDNWSRLGAARTAQGMHLDVHSLSSIDVRLPGQPPARS